MAANTGPYLSGPRVAQTWSPPVGVEQALVALDALSGRELFTEPGDLVFPDPAGEFIDDDRLRYRTAEREMLGFSGDQ